MATLTLYNYSGPLDTINKTLTGGTVKTGTQVDTPQSFTDMQIIIESATAPTWNYCTMSDTGRNYFITNIEWLGGKAFMLTLHVDVLTSNKTAIDSLYAMIQYSCLGSPLEHDTRLNFQDQTTIDDTEGTSILSSLIPWIAIRYWSLSKKYDLNDPITNETTQTKVAIMTPAAFQRFVEQMMNNNVVPETDRIIFCQAVQDVNIVYHTIDIAANYSYAGMSRVQDLTLQTPKKQFTYNFLIGTGQYMYLLDDEHQLQYLQKVEYQGPTIPEAVDWYLKAKYTIEIPYCGTFSLIPANAGIKTAVPLYWEVSVDWIAGNYVVTPQKGDSANPLLRTPLTYLQEIVPIPTKTTLPADYSLDNYNSNRISGHLREIGNWQQVTQGQADPFGMINKELRAYISDNMNYKLKGGLSQYTPLVPFGVEGIRTNISAVLPDTDTATFWSKWGYPDHEVRQISSITDGTWFKCEAVEMKGFSTITKSEVDEIEQKLLSGVYA